MTFPDRLGQATWQRLNNRAGLHSCKGTRKYFQKRIRLLIQDKLMVVDDRVAIIGSANINERSQRGDRDSELAAVLRDTDMIDG